MASPLEFALAYLSVGWQPIPVHYAVNGVCSCLRGALCHTPGKHPIPKGWQNTPFNESQLRGYWEENPNYNVGLVTGAKTNLVGLDVDARHYGFESLRELEDRFGVLPDTTTAETGGGGRHYLFQYPEGIFIPTKGNIRSGLDVRGEGGQIVAPPSYHDVGKRRYKWLPGCSPRDIMPAIMPSWLIAILEEQESIWVSESQASEDAADTYWGESRNTNLFQMGRRLRVIKDLNSDELGGILQSLNKSKCKPPLDEEEVNRIIFNVLRKGGHQVIVPRGDAGEAPGLIKVLSTDNLWSDEEEPIPYIIPNLLSEGEVCLLASPTEAGKSLIAMSLSLSIAAGLPAWGRGADCPPGRVMYCTEELAGRTIKRRFNKLRQGMGIPKAAIHDGNLCILPQQNLSLALRKPENIDALLLKAQQFKPTLVVLDTFVSYFGAPEKDSDANRAWFGAVPIALRAAHNCGVIVQHHTRKLSKGDDGKTIRYSNMSDDELNNEIRGTSDLAGVAERIWFIWKKSEERNDFGPKVCINFRNTKAREGDKHDPMQLVIQDPDAKTTTIQCAIGVKSKRYKEIEAKLRKILTIDEVVVKAELVRRLVGPDLSDTTAYDWITKFVDDRVLLLENKKDYRLNPSQLLITF